jgi:hypothetical protein
MLFVILSLVNMTRIDVPSLNYSQLDRIYEDVLPMKVGYNSVTGPDLKSTDDFFDAMKASYN